MKFRINYFESKLNIKNYVIQTYMYCLGYLSHKLNALY